MVMTMMKRMLETIAVKNRAPARADDESLSIRASSRAYNASRADDDTLGLVSFSEFWGKPEI